MESSTPDVLTTPERRGAPAAAAHPLPRLLPVRIAGLGGSTPDHRLRNQDLEQLVDTSDEWIVQRTGIRARRKAEPGTRTSQLAAAAAQEALADAGMEAGDLELLIVATATPDTPVPATACHVQHRIGAVRAAGFDLSIGCAGFTQALMVARSMVATGAFRNALVVGAEILTSVTDYSDRQSCILFGDGAGAAVLQPGGGRGEILDSVSGMDGSGAAAIEIPAGGTARPTSLATVQDRGHFIHLDGRRVFRFAVDKVTSCVRDLLERNNLTLDDLDLLVPHQANLRILEGAADRLGLPMDRVAVHIEEMGNTSSASIPLTLQHAVATGQVRPGGLVCLVGFGAGLAWAANLLRW